MLNVFNVLKRRLPTDRPSIDVIRHRLRSHLARRRLRLAAVAVVVALVGGAAVANAAGSDETPAPTTAGSATDLAERGAAAERTDRSQRAEGKQNNQGDQKPRKSKGSKAKSAQKESTHKKKRRKEEEEKKKKKKVKNWAHPMPGARTTSCYGARWGTKHAGVDLAAAAGTPIRAVGAGRVIGSGWLYTGYGKSVVIDHGNGYLTHYAHASRVKVSTGQRVKPGQKIALEGSTGNSTGPHLHLEVHRGMWNQIEPTKWLARHGVKIRGC